MRRLVEQTAVIAITAGINNDRTGIVVEQPLADQINTDCVFDTAAKLLSRRDTSFFSGGTKISEYPTREETDDRDHHKKFNKREPLPFFFHNDNYT